MGEGRARQQNAHGRREGLIDAIVDREVKNAEVVALWKDDGAGNRKQMSDHMLAKANLTLCGFVDWQAEETAKLSAAPPK